MTQKAFSEFLGINFDAYQSKELGRLKLNRDEILKLVQAAGVHPHSLDPAISLVACRFVEPFTQYTSDDWKRWRKERLPSKRTPETAQKQIASWTELLLSAASRCQALDQVMVAVASALTRIRSEYGLEPETNRILRERKVRETYTLKAKTLREDEGLRKAFNIPAKTLRGKFDDDEIEVSRDLVLPWVPESFTAPPSKQSSKRNPAA